MKFLRNLFKKEIKKINIKNLKEHINDLQEIKDIKEQKKQNLIKFNKEIEQLENNIQLLEQAEVEKGINVDTRINNKVLGNKKAYINHLNNLIQNLNNNNNTLNEFSQKSLKSYHATTYLFGKQVEPIINNIKNLDSNFKTKDKLNNKLNNIDKIKVSIKDYFNNIKKQKTCKEDINNFQTKLQSIKTEETEQQIKDIKKSRAYQNHIKKEVQLETNKKETKQEIINLFTNIKRPLKKFNIPPNKTITSYIEDPIQALLNDEQLTILEHTSKINLETLESNEKKRKKLQSSLNKIKQNTLTKLREQQLNSIIEKNQLKKEDNYTENLEFLEQKLKDQNKEIQEIKNKIKELEQFSFNKEQHVEEIKDSIKTNLNKEITITF